MKKVLITGGTTFVSKYAAQYFKEHNYDVYVLNRNTKPQVEEVTLIEGNRHEMGEKLKAIHFDVVADITAYDAADIIDLYEALGTFDQYIMISSSAVYPENDVQPLKEDSRMAVNKFWGKYGTDKIDAVSIKDWVTMCYGCFDKTPSFVPVYEDIEQRNYFSFYNYEYYLDVQKQQKLFPQTILLEDGLREAAEWYLANEKEVMKKPYIQYIDENFA